MYPFRLNPALTTRLREFCRAEGVSLFHTLLASFAALLYRYSGEEKIPIGSVTAGRNSPETLPLLGYFLNTVVLPWRLIRKSKFSAAQPRGPLEIRVVFGDLFRLTFVDAGVDVAHDGGLVDHFDRLGLRLQ